MRIDNILLMAELPLKAGTVDPMLSVLFQRKLKSLAPNEVPLGECKYLLFSYKEQTEDVNIYKKLNIRANLRVFEQLNHHQPFLCT